MQADLEAIRKEAEQAITAATDLSALEEIRVAYLGKKGSLTEMLKQLGSLSADERPKVGAEVNRIKQSLQSAIKDRQNLLKNAKLDAQLAQETIDVTLPGRQQQLGHLHPVTLIQQRVEKNILIDGVFGGRRP